MPRTSKAEAPVAMESEVLTSRHVELDDFTVVFEDYHVDADGEPVFKGLPDDRCQCPHWGVVVSDAPRPGLWRRRCRLSIPSERNVI
jgi:hypothetical protein